MSFDPTKPFKCVDGVNINLTLKEISDLQTQQAAWAAQAVITSMNQSAHSAMLKSEETMSRIQEAVSLGNTTWTTPDVVAWATYRAALRPLITSNIEQPLPIQPPYPANT